MSSERGSLRRWPGKAGILHPGQKKDGLKREDSKRHGPLAEGGRKAIGCLKVAVFRRSGIIRVGSETDCFGPHLGSQWFCEGLVIYAPNLSASSGLSLCARPGLAEDAGLSEAGNVGTVTDIIMKPGMSQMACRGAG